jgi:ABC-type branched-subunit amino acid transport system substrate-binding protein
MIRPIRVVGATAVVAVATLALPNLSATAAVKAGQRCTKLGEVKDGLTCVREGSRRVYRKPAAAAPTTAASSGGATPAPAPAGLATVPGFDGKTIKIGYLGNVSTNAQFPSSALFADGGKALTAGYNSAISRVNDAGGIAGKYKVEVVFGETYYDAGEVIKRFAEQKDNVVLIGQIYGTPLTQALREPLKQANLIGAPVSLDFEWAVGDNFLPVGATYQSQIINVIDWYLKEGGGAGKKICSLSIAPNPYAVAMEEGFDFAVKELRFNAGPKVRWTTADAVAQQLKAASCDAVANAISGEAHMPGLLTSMDKISFNPIMLSNSPSFASRRVTPENSNLFGKQVIVAIDGAQWGDTTIQGMKEHMADIQKYAPEYLGNVNPATEWGWAQAKTVVALLEKAVSLGDLSRDGIKKAMGQLGKVPLGGMYPEWTYGTPSQRVPPTQAFIMKVDIATPGGLALIKPYDAAAAKAYRR